MKLLRKTNFLALGILLFSYLPASFAMEPHNQNPNHNQPSHVSQFLNYAKNKANSALSCIGKTIKSDLGLEAQNSSEPNSLVKDLGAACRLLCYGILAEQAVGYIISKLIPINDLPPQFKEGKHPSFVHGVIVAPLIEEMIFTYGILNILGHEQLLGPTYGSIATSALFGATHYHENPKRWATQATLIAAKYFFTHRYYSSKKIQWQ